jgi:Uma2 family endonuclease
MGARTLLSAADFLRLPPQEGKKFELDEGELVEMTLPTYQHNRVVRRVLQFLDRYLESHPAGEVFAPDAGYILSQDPATLRGPDVSFLRAERARLIDPKASAFQGAPDLAIEVVSPSDSARDLQRKVTQYMAAGAHAVWIVYPDS